MKVFADLCIVGWKVEGKVSYHDKSSGMKPMQYVSFLKFINWVSFDVLVTETTNIPYLCVPHLILTVTSLFSSHSRRILPTCERA